MASKFLSKHHFAKTLKLEGKTFCFYKYCDFYIYKENKKVHESTPNYSENARFHLGCCTGASVTFRIVY